MDPTVAHERVTLGRSKLGETQLQALVAMKAETCVLTIEIDRVRYEPDTFTIQVGPAHHFMCESVIRYMDHSFTPSVRVERQGQHLYLMALRDITAGDAITFDYNTTEFDMRSPFNDYETGRRVAGWRHLSDAERAATAPNAAPWLTSLEIERIVAKRARTK